MQPETFRTLASVHEGGFGENMAGWQGHDAQSKITKYGCDFVRHLQSNRYKTSHLEGRFHL